MTIGTSPLGPALLTGSSTESSTTPATTRPASTRTTKESFTDAPDEALAEQRPGHRGGGEDRAEHQETRSEEVSRTG